MPLWSIHRIAAAAEPVGTSGFVFLSFLPTVALIFVIYTVKVLYPMGKTLIKVAAGVKHLIPVWVPEDLEVEGKLMGSEVTIVAEFMKNKLVATEIDIK